MMSQDLANEIEQTLQESGINIKWITHRLDGDICVMIVDPKEVQLLFSPNSNKNFKKDHWLVVHNCMVVECAYSKIVSFLNNDTELEFMTYEDYSGNNRTSYNY